MVEIATAGLVVGRERELAAVERLLALNEAEFRALVVEGEPGIGKTAGASASSTGTDRRTHSALPAGA